MMTRTEVDTLQAKVMVLERSSSQRTGEIQADVMVRALQDRHRREISGLQSQYDALAAKLEATVSQQQIFILIKIMRKIKVLCNFKLPSFLNVIFIIEFSFHFCCLIL
jgi:hypothetical protein